MKKILLIIQLITCFKASAQIQQNLTSNYPKHEFGVAYGSPYWNGYEISIATTDAFLGGFIDVLNSFTGNKPKEPYAVTWKSSGSPSIQYKYFAKKHWSVGAQIIYNNSTIFRISQLNNAVLSEKKIHSIFTDFNFEYHYLKRPKSFDLYSGVRVGYRFDKTKSKIFVKTTLDDLPIEKAFNIGYHINLIALRYGNKIGGFLELGYGMGSWINGGLSYRL